MTWYFLCIFICSLYLFSNLFTSTFSCIVLTFLGLYPWGICICSAFLHTDVALLLIFFFLLSFVFHTLSRSFEHWHIIVEVGHLKLKLSRTCKLLWAKIANKLKISVTPFYLFKNKAVYVKVHLNIWNSETSKMKFASKLTATDLTRIIFKFEKCFGLWR